MGANERRETGPEASPAAGLGTLHLAVLLFGVAGLFGKWIALPALLIVFGRLGVAALVLGAVVGWRRQLRWPRGRDAWLVAGCGVLLAFHWGAFFHAIQLSSVAVGLLGYATAPVFAAVLEPVLFRERFSAAGLGAALAALAGTLVIASAAEGGPPGGDLRGGLAWGVAAGGSFALLSLANRFLRGRHGSLPLVFFQVAAAALAVAPLALWGWQAPTPAQWGLLVALGAIFTALAHGLFIASLRRVRAGVATLVAALEPVYGIALAFLLLGERPGPRTLAGGIVILAAALWLPWPRRRSGTA